MESHKKTVVLTGEGLTLQQVVDIARHNASVEVESSCRDRVDKSRACIESRLRSDDVFYGINTGFGFLSDIRIERENLQNLQLNLIRSHACGVGAPLERDIVRAVLALRIQTMVRGHSGVRFETIELMRQFLNHDITPWVPSKGSVGASGDLAPLSHIALCLIGESKVYFRGALVPTEQALAVCKLKALTPEAKEGLCLINGTQVMTAIGLLACQDVAELFRAADIATAVTLDATRGTATAFRSEIQTIRPHRGQSIAAQNLRTLLENDDIAKSHVDCKKVQDAYSLRCAPQVHGAARNAYDHVLSTLLTEANSSTDNPLVFAESNEILSGGNFHGEPVAMVLDYLAIAVAEIASIAERRIDKLVNPHMSGLPAFLTHSPGLNSGYMIPHVVAAALVAENKILAHPASVDSLPTSADKEDHVSMGMTSALKLREIIKNVAHVLAIELVTGCEGLEFHLPTRGGRGVEATRLYVRTFCPSMTTDRSLSNEFETLATAILSGELTQKVQPSLSQPLL